MTWRGVGREDLGSKLGHLHDDLVTNQKWVFDVSTDI